MARAHRQPLRSEASVLRWRASPLGFAERPTAHSSSCPSVAPASKGWRRLARRVPRNGVRHTFRCLHLAAHLAAPLAAPLAAHLAAYLAAHLARGVWCRLTSSSL